MIGGWTKIFSPTVVNEFRAATTTTTRRGRARSCAADVAAQLGIENAPSLGPDRRGFPQFQFTAGTNRPTNITDAGRNVDRTLRQNAFSLSDNLTWVNGGHTLKGGGLWTRNIARDGFGFGVNYRGRYRFRGAATGNAFTDFLLGLPTDVSDHLTNRGPLDGHSNDFATFVQDDWRVNKSLTVFLGLRYEVVGAWHEKGLTLANFLPGRRWPPRRAERTGRGAAAAWPDRARPHPQRPTRSACRRRCQHRQEQLQPAGRFRLAARREQQDGAPGRLRLVPSDRRGSGHPRPAGHQRVPLRQRSTRRRAPQRLLAAARRPWTSPTSATRESIPTSRVPTSISTTSRSSASCPGSMGLRVSYIGSTMRKLLVDRDYNTLPASTVPFDPAEPGGLCAAAVPPLRLLHGHRREPRQRPVPCGCSSSCFGAGANGLAFNAAYTLAHSDSNAPDTGNSTIGPVQFDPYDIEKDRGPDPNVVKHRVVANATWDIPVGRGRPHGADMSRWADALFGGWTVSSMFQARSGQNLTPFFSGFYTTSPWNTGKPLDGLGNFFCQRLAAGSDRGSEHGGSRDAFFDQTAYALPATGQTRQRQEGQPARARAPGS